MKDKLRKIIKWVSLTIGTALLAFAAWNVINILTPDIRIEGTITPIADQEGFAPMVLPEGTRSSRIFEPTEIPIVIAPKAIVIEKIELEAPVLETEQISVRIAEQQYAQFLVPEEYAAGWHAGSAPIGVPGNTVISGHHNAYGAVFKDLIKLEIGDVIKLVDEEGRQYKYYIANKMIFPEKDESLEVRLENGRWIQPTDDERLTVVTCWPADSNSHRLILVAVPEPDYSIYDEPPPLPDYLAQIDLKTPVALHLVQRTETPLPLEECQAVNISPFNVNIRKTPSLNGEIIGNLRAGSLGTCIARNADNTWVKIRFEGVEGWVSAGVVDMLMDIALLPLEEE
jgi:LPXTG-site transpeptidase (sortase) family protein